MATPPARHMADLLAQVRACRLCQAHLPLGPRPVIQASVTARLLIIGQAPGTRVHATGIPWNDPSGDRLREWLQLDRDTFYDPARIAIMPMGLCYPGKGRSGDLPPRPECAPQWHGPVQALLPVPRLTLLVGRYAQEHYLGRGGDVSGRVAQFASALPDFFPLPHPSPRNRRWLAQRPWFAEQVLPALRACVAAVLDGQPVPARRWIND